MRRPGTGSGRPETAVRQNDGAQASLQAEDLTLGFGEKAILSDVSASIQPGAVTALIGPTGSGKTTLLRTFNRMNDKVIGFRHGGDVLLGGRSIWHPAVELMALRRRVGMLFQRPNPFPMSILENVVAGPRAHKLARHNQLRAIAKDKLSEVGLWDAVSDRLSDSPFRLSGGQQQLLCLARALAVRPEVLLLDEPTSALDPISTAKVEELVSELKKDYTIAIVTHNMQQAARVSDYTAFLYLGELIEFDETSKIFTNPGKKATEDYITGRYG